MARSLQTQLRVPADSRFLALIQDNVRELATIAGLARKEVLALELAAEEAFLNIRDHAYPDGAAGDVFVDGEILEGELRLSFRDEGLPLDPALLTQAGPEPGGARRLGLTLIHHAVDEMHWVNLGRQGKSLCLVKRLPAAVAPAPAEFPVHVQQAPAQDYAIRPLRPDEAPQVSRMFWLAYGYSYKIEQFYRPEGILDLVNSGKLISYVAVTRDDEIVGHIGMLRPEPVAMAEMAALVVSPAHRGRGLMVALTDALAAKAREMGLFGLAFDAVTSHAVSQREVEQFGAQPCGLELAATLPLRFKAMGLETAPQQRESLLHCFKYQATPPPALVHVPKRHQGIVGRIYANLQRPLIQAPPGQAVSPGRYTVTFDHGLDKGSIRVIRADARQWPVLLQAATDLADIAGAQTVRLDLPLAQPATALLCEQAEQAGFFFAGIWPHEAEDGDMLRLTRLSRPVNLELLRLHAAFAQELASYVGAEMERAKA